LESNQNFHQRYNIVVRYRYCLDNIQVKKDNYAIVNCHKQYTCAVTASNVKISHISQIIFLTASIQNTPMQYRDVGEFYLKAEPDATKKWTWFGHTDSKKVR